MICGSIFVGRGKDTLKKLIQAQRFTSLFELRLDKTRRKNFPQFLTRIKKPLIATIRPESIGGHFLFSERKRVDSLKNLLSSNFNFVDVEIETFEKFYPIFKNANREKLILSYHNFNRTENSISRIYKKLKKHNPKIIKITMFANDAYDNVKLIRQIKGLKDKKKNYTIFCMGEYGKISRILYKRFGSYFTYGHISEEKKTAEGQISVEELKNLYRADKVSEDTQVYVLIGNPVSHSQSPYLFNTLFIKKNINAVYIPLPIQNLKHLKDIFDEFRISGASVTIPHKVQVIKYLDEITDEAKNCCAVNTIFRRNGKLVGENFDWCGVYLPLKKILTRLGKEEGRALIIGAGGAARASLLALSLLNFKIFALNRTISNLKLLQKDFDFNIIKKNDLKSLKPDVIVNATPVGMYPLHKVLPISLSVLKKGAIVYDLVYTPPETKLIQQAKSHGCYTISGLEMFKIQASLQFKLWFKEALDDGELMRFC